MQCVNERVFRGIYPQGEFDGGEVTRYVARHGKASVANAVLISAIQYIRFDRPFSPGRWDFAPSVGEPEGNATKLLSAIRRGNFFCDKRNHLILDKTRYRPQYRLNLLPIFSFCRV